MDIIKKIDEAFMSTVNKTLMGDKILKIRKSKDNKKALKPEILDIKKDLDILLKSIDFNDDKSSKMTIRNIEGKSIQIMLAAPKLMETNIPIIFFPFGTILWNNSPLVSFRSFRSSSFT